MTVQEIVNQLEVWSKAYYSGNEIVSDAEFDALEDELRIRDPQNSWFTHVRETAGYGTKVTHIYETIGSLEKIHSLIESEVLKNARRTIRLSAKLDGTSLVTYFDNGNLLYAATRGNGTIGVDVTQHYNAICQKYHIHVPTGFTGAIRGEVVFKNSNWELFKAKHPEAKAPRNSGTGLINQKVVQEDEELLDYVVYDVVATNIPQEDYWDLLSSFGYPLAPAAEINPLVSTLTDEDIERYFNQWKQTFPCDGAVLRLVTTPMRRKTDNLYAYPKEHEAYKFQAEIKQCEVQDIVWQLGRTGKLTPVLKINPVLMSGAVVTSITAHNAQNVEELKLGKGSVVLAYRSGEVIPTLHKSLVPSQSVTIPTHCPFCGTKLERTATGKDLVCTYDGCAGKAKYRIFNFIQVMCEGVKGLGDVFLENFVNEVAESFGYTEHEVMTLDSFLIPAVSHKGTPFNSLGTADNKVANEVLERLLQPKQKVEKIFLGLGIKLLGIEAAKRIASSPAETREVLEVILEEDVATLPRALGRLLPGQVALINNIYREADLIKSIVLFYGIDNLEYNGKGQVRYYAITGGLSKPRNQIEAELAEHGWQMTSNMNKAELLINNDTTSKSSKNVAAQQLGKPIVSEEEFRKSYLN